MDKFFKLFSKNNSGPKAKTMTTDHMEDIAEGNVKFENKIDHVKNDKINEKIENFGNINLDNSPNENIVNAHPNSGNLPNAEVVVVNSYENLEKKAEGFYYKKYLDKVQQLKLSNPILIERENMKVNFDSDVVDYLVNDMTMIFRNKQIKVDNGQVNKFNI
jgi:hypothetical protein